MLDDWLDNASYLTQLGDGRMARGKGNWAGLPSPNLLYHSDYDLSQIQAHHRWQLWMFDIVSALPTVMVAERDMTHLSRFVFTKASTG
jgi:hypothetical protein